MRGREHVGFFPMAEEGMVIVFVKLREPAFDANIAHVILHHVELLRIICINPSEGDVHL